ncbi:MAG: hypothetical protein IPK93_03730 [Solirubrobacterales bacterium]|nr:hypothetical protein [Solirubrobacterales bacterium]
MRVFRPFAIAFCSLAIVAAASTPSSEAGEYMVRQCEGSGHQGFFGKYAELGTDHVDVVNGCTTAGPGKVAVYQDRSGVRLPYLYGGKFTWDAPEGVEVFGTVFTSRLDNANGIKASLLGLKGGSGDIELDEGMAHDGQQRTTRWTNRNLPRSRIVAKLDCQRDDGCNNAGGGPKAFFEVTDAEFKSRDVIKPTVAGSGFLWIWGNDWRWHRGSAAYRIDARDEGAGVASTFLLVNGLRVELDPITCTGDQSTYATRFAPCPESAVRTAVANMAQAPFQEGVNVVEFCSADYAVSLEEANRTCTAARVVFVDNVAPTAPIELRPVGGTDWRSENGFDVVWRNPEGGGSKITEADFQVLRIADNTIVDSGTANLGASPALPAIDLPEPGEYRVEVRLRDSAGNLGPPSSTTLRFDDASPGDVAPEPPPGWISSDELPFLQEIERAEAGGPSGVGGYALAVSRTGPVAPCPTGVCQPLELSLNDGIDDRVVRLNDLSEGNHWVSAVAASGARVASETAGTRILRVDKTDPVTSLKGLTNGWVNRPVTLTAAASDSASGMTPKPGDDGNPVTVIRAGDSAPYEVPGNSAVFTVAEEGTTRVDYWARDLAGNSNDGLSTGEGENHAKPGTATVRIDRRPPQIEFHQSLDPLDPEMIRATVRDGDSGLDSGTISLRPLGTDGKFTDLETEESGSTLLARIPSDDLPSGKYLIRAEARDRAGNVADTAGNGSGIVLELPLKKPVQLSASIVRGKRFARKSIAGYGSAVQVEGRLTRGGKAASGISLLVEERFVTGSRRVRRSSRVRTDGAGRYVTRVGSGPSRAIRVSYAGSKVNQRTSSRELSLTVKDRTTFRIKPRVLRNGGRVRMTGSVLGKGALRPARGKLVAIQYYDPSRAKWRPVEVLRANRRGHFRYSYRFRTIDFAQRILFRAVSLPEAGWPFRPSTSGRKSVIVYPAD